MDKNTINNMMKDSGFMDMQILAFSLSTDLLISTLGGEDLIAVTGGMLLNKSGLIGLTKSKIHFVSQTGFWIFKKKFIQSIDINKITDSSINSGIALSNISINIQSMNYTFTNIINQSAELFYGKLKELI